LSTREALVSPFRGGGLEVDLTAAFQRQEAAGSYVDSMLHIGGKSVRFEQDAGGCWNARLEVERAIWAVDPWASQNDRVSEQVLDVHACGKTAEQVRQEGLVAVVEDRVPTPGSYQVRVAVKNAGSDPVGSATQFLVIPDLKRTRLAVAGVTVWAGDAPAAASGDVTYRPASEGDPAMRQFHAGEELRYSFRVLGAATDVRLRVLRDGKEAATVPVTVGAGGAVTGVLPLVGMTPGSYVLGAVASMAPGKGKTQSVEEWVDFEIR
jgi:hypothetical protein